MKNTRMTVNNALQFFSVLVKRVELMSRLGKQYDNDRDVYEALGYPTTIEYKDYAVRYSRQDMAKAVIDRPVKHTWKGSLHLIESEDDNETMFEQAWDDLNKKLKLKNKFIRTDKLCCLGTYSILLLGLDDIRFSSDFINPVSSGKRTLLYVRPLGENNVTIHSYDNDPKSERYGLPVQYDITLEEKGSGKSYVLRTHYSRIIHITRELLESEVKGIPYLESVYNRLMDLEKLVGGSAEMFWRGARPGYHAKVDPEYKMTNAVEDDLKAQFDEFEHKLRRILTTEGISIEALAAQVFDPKNHVDVQIQMISAVTGIPKRMLMGSERGELSSTQDQNEWDSFIQTRREEHAEVNIVRPFVDACIRYGILPIPSTEDYQVGWSDLFAHGEKELAEVGKIRASALKEYASIPVAEEVIPVEAFLDMFLGLSQDQINLIKEMREAAIGEERELSPEEEEIITQPIPEQEQEETIEEEEDEEE